MRIIDLTHVIRPEMPVYPGTERPIFRPANTIARDGFREVKITFYSHTGTHIDAPAHLLEGMPTLDELDIAGFIGKAAILDFSKTGSKGITIEDLMQHSKTIEAVDFIILKTGWSRHWGSADYYKDFPTLTGNAAGWLSESRLKGVGVDAISVDEVEAVDLHVHRQLLSRNMVIIENLTNLDPAGSDIFTLCVLPLKLEKADGSPVRAIAILTD